MDHTRIQHLLNKAGYPAFELDTYGFPLPGPVIKYFREQMTYVADGKNKHWTQAELAHKLGITEWSVRSMETKNHGLDSIERRRTLAALLKIPPVMLGLASLDNLINILDPHEATAKFVGIEHVDLYSTAYDVYNSQHAKTSLSNSIGKIEQWITKITADMQEANTALKISLSRVLYDFNVLAAKVYADLLEWNKAFDHIDNAVELATILNKPELIMMGLYFSGDFRLVKHQPILAIRDFQNALTYKGTNQTTGATFSALALATAMSNSASAEMDVRKLLEQAEKYTNVPGNAGILYNPGRHLLDKADTLILSGKFKSALRAIDDAEYELNDNEARRFEYATILRAECYLKQQKPEYEQATLLMQQILENQVNAPNMYHVSYIARLYQLIEKSPYAKAPNAVDLLQLLKKIKQ